MENLKIETCCFTGHRPQKLPWGFNEKDKRFIKLKQWTEFQIEKAIWLGYKHFISGLALGFDMLCAEIVLKLKNKYKHISLECAIPCKNQADRWSKSFVDIYNNILNKADRVSLLHEKYDDGCMLERNKYMVDNSSYVIALYNGQPGGTKQTVSYAKHQGVDIKFINPNIF